MQTLATRLHRKPSDQETQWFAHHQLMTDSLSLIFIVDQRRSSAPPGRSYFAKQLFACFIEAYNGIVRIVGPHVRLNLLCYGVVPLPLS